MARKTAKVIDGTSGRLVDDRDATVMSFKTDIVFRDRVKEAARQESQTVTAYLKQLINRDLDRKGI